MNNPEFFEYAVIGGYLVLLFAIAIIFKSFNSNTSDFFRGGGKTQWWLCGTSIFMASFSAWTFTGAAGVAYNLGWSVVIIFLANTIGFLGNYFFFAARFRQMRCITVPEVIKFRFGEGVRQLIAAVSVLLMPIGSAVTLVGLSTFVSAVFGYNPVHIVIGIGVIVVFYSMLGGSWAVMAADFMQGIILLPVTILIAVLAVSEIGGISNIFSAIEEQNLTDSFAMLKGSSSWLESTFRTEGFALASTQNAQAGQFIDYSLFWMLGMFSLVLVQNNSLSSSVRYFAVKDGKEAKKAAILAAALMFFGSVIWFLPPIIARLFFPDLVSSIEGIRNPHEASYALLGQQLLPKGMTGLMVVAMLAATISSMDTGLNWTAGIITNDLYPGVCRIFKSTPVTGKKLLMLGRLATIMLGALIISSAIIIMRKDDFSLFSAMQLLNAYVFVPLAIPMFMGIIIKKSPWWSSLVSLVATSLVIVYGQDNSFNQQELVFAQILVGGGAFIATMPWWSKTSPKYRQQVEEFFIRMRPPIDFAYVVGEDNDYRQLRVMGLLSTIAGGFIYLLLLIPGNDWSLGGRGGILLVGGIAIAVGSTLLHVGQRKKNK